VLVALGGTGQVIRSEQETQSKESLFVYLAYVFLDSRFRQLHLQLGFLFLFSFLIPL
jgi:hypothetical protein